MSLDNGFVTAKFLRNVAERMRAFKQLSYEHMAITTGDIVGRRNDTTLVRTPADNYWLVGQFRVLSDLHRGVKGIHIDGNDLAWHTVIGSPVNASRSDPPCESPVPPAPPQAVRN